MSDDKGQIHASLDLRERAETALSQQLMEDV